MKLSPYIPSAVAAQFKRLTVPVRNLVKSVRSSHDGLPNNIKWSIRRELLQRLNAGNGPSVCFLPTHTWFSRAFQRPQQMARALAEAGCSVIYYEPWSEEQIVMTPESLQERAFVGVHDIAPRLHLLRCPEAMLQEYLIEVPPDIVVMLWPHQASFIPQETGSFVVYEIIDHPELIPDANDEWQRTHEEWIDKADIVVVTADDLHRLISPHRPDILSLPNGVRVEDWLSLKTPDIPEDMVAARSAPVVVGYYGSIAEWFDWEMWKFAASARPDWAFVLIGLPYDGDAYKIMEEVVQFPNMYYLGAKPYSMLPSYLAHFDIATIPFIVNPITNACSPVKLFEYMTAGKPIVGSAMREILKYQSVLVAESPESFASRLDEGLQLRDDADYHIILQTESEMNTWRSRAEALCKTYKAVYHRQKGIPKRLIVSQARIER